MKFNDQPAAGFHVPKLFERILDIDKCWLQPEPTNAIRLFVKDYLLKNGLDGVFFTDEPIIDLKKCVLNKTRFKMSADKLKLITTNKMSEFEIKALQYNQTPLTHNEIKFIQACAKDQSYEEVAKELQKSVSTIYGYRDRIFKKLQVKQRTAMVMTALKRNYIDL
jgi:DNA-binding NarL/FixJ family response regulator